MEKKKEKEKNRQPKKGRKKKINEGIKQWESSPLIVRLHIPVNCLYWCPITVQRL
jgi:hypothetical protein